MALAKLQRLRFLFEESGLPDQPSLSRQRTIDDELGDLHSSQVQITSQATEATPETAPPQSSNQPLKSTESNKQDKSANKSKRLQLLFGDVERPQQPSPSQQRIIDDEMGDFYSSQDQNSSPAAEAASPTINHAMVREVVRADPYDSLEDGSDIDDPFIAACARKEAERLVQSRNKSKMKKSQGNKPQTQKRYHSMDLRTTDPTGGMAELKPSEGTTKLGTFCPIHAVAKFPYKYIDKEHSEAVADAFFNAGKFWERTFDV